MVQGGGGGGWGWGWGGWGGEGGYRLNGVNERLHDMGVGAV